MTPHSISRWFAFPELSQPDLRLRARALWIVSWPFFGVVAILLGIGVVVEPQTLARRATTIAAVGALTGLLHIISISRAGRPLVEIRYFFYLTNDRETAAPAVVFLANARCNQENLIDQLKHGAGAMRMPVDTLLSN